MRRQEGTFVSVTNKLVRVEQSGKRCPAVNEAAALLGDKWTILVLGVLSKERPTLRYNELHRAIAGISQRMLTLTLKTLEANGLVTRTVFPSVPPRVEYTLTPLGRSLSEPLRALVVWSQEHHVAMAESRRAYAGHIKVATSTSGPSSMRTRGTAS